MFGQLFKLPEAVAGHRAGALLEERRAFLAHQAGRGLSTSALRAIASGLLLVADKLELASRPGVIITCDEIKRKAPNQDKFRSLATRWLRFLGRLQPQPTPVNPFADQIKAFADYLDRDRGLAPATIRGRCWFVLRFLNRLSKASRSLREITPHRIDESFKEMLNQGAYARITIRDWANALRAFFRYAEMRGWCRTGLAASIRGPRIFAQAWLPIGPSWDEVRQLLAMTEGDRRADIRDRAILMLQAVYGLRAAEVNRLRLEDFDWEREVFTVAFSKTQRPRTYPLTRTVAHLQPQLYDLRHSFAVHRLTSWYRQGANVQRLLHPLSVYLGHVHIRCTQVYLSMTPELLHAASQRFENYVGKEGCHD